MNRFLVPFFLLGVGFLFGPLAAAADNIAIATVPVGNAGNAPDPLTGYHFGAVSYS